MKDTEQALTGKDVVEAFKSDVSSFFETSPPFNLRVDCFGNSPTCAGSGSNTRIQLPDFFFEKAVVTTEDLVFLLLILGHETAHYLHRHNEHRDKSKDETKALEIWADYFGTKVAMVVMTYGLETIERFGKLLVVDSNSRTNALAHGLATLATSYFNIKSDKYPPSYKRVGVCISGMLSFVQVQYILQDYRKFGIAGYNRACLDETKVKRGLGFQNRLYQNQTLKNSTKETHFAGPDDNSEITLIKEIHRTIQSGEKALFAGMDEFVAMWLDLDYSLPAHVSQENARTELARLNKTLKELGLLEEDPHL